MINHELLIHNLYNTGYCVIDDFLDLTHYQSLRNQAINMHQQGLFKNAKIGLKNQATLNANIRTDTILWLEEQSFNPAIKAYLQATQKLMQAINQSLFLGLFEFETHFAVYEPGAYYKKHVDQFATTKDRKISCVYYLNNEWQDNVGGELVLYNQEQQVINTVKPHGNRFICFNSELPHEVCQTQERRYSITGWMKSRALRAY